MNLRLSLLVFGLLFGVSIALEGQDLGRVDRLYRDYLAETVRRGLPLCPGSATGGEFSVPQWAFLDRELIDARSLEPGPDMEYLAALITSNEGDRESAVRILRQFWPDPGVVLFHPSDWGQALFNLWIPNMDEKDWTEAWLAWTGKVYHPCSLVRGLEVLEKADPGAVEPLLSQSVELYPEDRRFLPLILRHPGVVQDSVGLLSLDKVKNGGWAPSTILSWLEREPETKDQLIRAGYSTNLLENISSRDYGLWLLTSNQKSPGVGEWVWDADRDGQAESRLVFQDGTLTTWTKTNPDSGVWTLGFKNGKPDTVTESRGGSRWTLRYEVYPFIRSLDYQWGNQVISYRFLPLGQSVPLWPPERFHSESVRLPSSLAQLWIPLEPRSLVQKATTVETWADGRLIRKIFLYMGEVWLAEEDLNRSGKIDTWSYYLNGNLVSVYHDTEGAGSADLRELFRKGELTQVQSKASRGNGLEFVLFPQDGVQIWDPHGDRRPLDRLFFWEGSEKLNALVFSGGNIPWETMPVWEPRP